MFPTSANVVEILTIFDPEYIANTQVGRHVATSSTVVHRRTGQEILKYRISLMPFQSLANAIEGNFFRRKCVYGEIFAFEDWHTSAELLALYLFYTIIGHNVPEESVRKITQKRANKTKQKCSVIHNKLTVLINYLYSRQICSFLLCYLNSLYFQIFKMAAMIIAACINIQRLSCL